MAVDAATVQTGGGGGGAPSWLTNWRVLTIAGGAIAALVIIMMQNRKPAAAPNPNAGGQLGPSANIALGQIAYDQIRIAGEQGVQSAERQSQLVRMLDSIFGELLNVNANVTRVGDTLYGQDLETWRRLAQAQNAIYGELVGIPYDPGAAAPVEADLETIYGEFANSSDPALSPFDRGAWLPITPAYEIGGGGLPIAPGEAGGGATNAGGG